MNIYENEDFQVEIKEDDSPLTIADKRANEIINHYLIPTEIPVISEGNKQFDGKIKVVGSRSHMNQDTLKYIESPGKDLIKEVEIVFKGSSLKFCLLAEGDVRVYSRFAPTLEWDTAAGQAICEAVGLKVINKGTSETMVYNREKLFNNHFLVSNLG